MVILAHQIRLTPHGAQAEYFRKACGTSRFAWNWGLAEWKRRYEVGERVDALKLKKDFNALKPVDFPWTYEVTVRLAAAIPAFASGVTSLFRQEGPLSTVQTKGGKRQLLCRWGSYPSERQTDTNPETGLGSNARGAEISRQSGFGNGSSNRRSMVRQRSGGARGSAGALRKPSGHRSRNRGPVVCLLQEMLEMWAGQGPSGARRARVCLRWMRLRIRPGPERSHEPVSYGELHRNSSLWRGRLWL